MRPQVNAGTFRAQAALGSSQVPVVVGMKSANAWAMQLQGEKLPSPSTFRGRRIRPHLKGKLTALDKTLHESWRGWDSS